MQNVYQKKKTYLQSGNVLEGCESHIRGRICSLRHRCTQDAKVFHGRCFEVCMLFKVEEIIMHVFSIVKSDQ